MRPLIRSLYLLLMIVFFSFWAFAQSETGNHGDPFRKDWRSHKIRAREILRKMTVERLLPETTPEVLKWLSSPGPEGESKFILMEKELGNSELLFVEITPENPDGHNPDKTCGHTTPRQGAPIQISKVDCGKLAPEKAWEVLIGDTVHHFGFGDAFSDLVSLAIVKAYRFHIETDPTFALHARYRGNFLGKPTVLTLDVPKGRTLALQGGINMDLSRLPGLQGISNKYGTSGSYSSFSYATWLEGIGREPNGNIGYGELEGTRRTHTRELTGELTITVNPEFDSIVVTGSREIQSGSGSTRTQKEEFTIAMVHYPPTSEEIEAARRAKNTVEFLTLLDKSPEHVLPEDEEALLKIFNSGISQSQYTSYVEKATAKRFWKLVDAIAPLLPKGTRLESLGYLALDRKDADFLNEILNQKSLSGLFDLEAKRNSRTLLGNVIESIYKQSDNQAAVFENDLKLAPLVSALLRAGVKTSQKVTDIVNRPQLPLSSLLARSIAAIHTSKAIMDAMAPGEIMQLDERERTPMDYLSMHWVIFKNNCASAAETEVAKATYDTLNARFDAAYELMKSAGHDGKRRGCLYYNAPRAPICEWSHRENKFLLYYTTDYLTKPRVWSGSRPQGYDICG